MTWKRVRVVVELPVRGEFSENDLKWALLCMVGEHALHNQINKYRSGDRIIRTGRMEVKSLDKVIGTKLDSPRRRP